MINRTAKTYQGLKFVKKKVSKQSKKRRFNGLAGGGRKRRRAPVGAGADRAGPATAFSPERAVFVTNGAVSARAYTPPNA
jgi:hypothetical protein